MTRKEKNSSFILNGVITATSNKQGKFDSDNPRKSIYLTLLDTDEISVAQANGLKVYTSQDGNAFTIIKASEAVSLFVQGIDEVADKIATSIQDKNFKTEKPVAVAVLKGASDRGNTYYRLFAINVSSLEDIQFTEVSNPFGK